MKNPHRALIALLVVAAFATAAILYGRLPDNIPVHWNAAGEIDGYLPRPWGVLLLPMVMLALWPVFEAVLHFSPQGFRLEKARDAVGMMVIATLAMLFLVFVAQLLAALGRDVRIEHFVAPGIGLLFIVMGNYLGKVPKNFFIGIRTPWTLASDEVWYRTHRFGGPLFVIAGLVLLIAMPFDAPAWLMAAVILPAAIIPLIYSFMLYRRLEGFDREREG